MKSFKNTHSEPTISLLEVHPKETIKDVHNNLVLGIPIKKKKKNFHYGTVHITKTGTDQLPHSRGKTEQQRPF